MARRFNRILLKLSGEALMGPGQFGIDPDTVATMAAEVKAPRKPASSSVW
jgi:uridylate kinase